MLKSFILNLRIFFRLVCEALYNEIKYFILMYALSARIYKLDEK